MVPRLLKIALILVCLCSTVADAKVGSTLGFFNLTSKNSAGTSTLSNLGHVKMFYDFPVLDRFNIRPSYSLYLLGIDTNDIGYGFDFEFSYFPFSFNRSMRLGQKNLNFVSSERIRPYIGASFHQRQYQSIQSNYAGVGGTIGAHLQFTPDYHFIAGLSVLGLKGPLSSSITEQQLYFGASLNL